MMKGMMNSEWVVIIPPYLSYLLVLRVLRSEVAAHELELDVEMRQPVEQIHPPRRRVVHYGSHPDPATRRLSLHPLNRFLTQTLLRNSRPLWVNRAQKWLHAQFTPPVVTDGAKKTASIDVTSPNILSKIKVQYPQSY